MNRRRAFPNSSLISTLLFSLALLGVLAGAIFVDYRWATRREVENVRQVLLGSANEQARIFNAGLEGQFNAIRAFASSMSVQSSYNMDILGRRLAAIVENSKFMNMSVAGVDGRNFYIDGSERDISDREYFRKSAAGEDALEFVEAAKSSGVQSFIISTPVKNGGAITGVVVASFNEDAIRDNLIPQVYSGEAYSFVCDLAGRVLIGSREKNYKWGDLHVGKNFSIFSALRGENEGNAGVVEKLRADLKAGGSGLVSYTMKNGSKRIAVYTPLGVNDWRLFNVVPEALMTDAVIASVKEASLLYGVALLTAFLVLSLVVHNERKNVKSMAAEQLRLEDAHRRLQVSEQEYRIAAQQTGKTVMRYDLVSKRMFYSPETREKLRLTGDGTDFCERSIASGAIAPESQNEYRAFFSAMERGERSGSLRSLRFLPKDGKPQWIAAEFTTVHDERGKPLHAVISFWDITEEREKEAAYKKWEDSISSIDTRKIALFEHNLTLDCGIKESGGLIGEDAFMGSAANTFNGRTRILAERNVYPDDRQAYVSFVNRERLIADYYQGNIRQTFDFRCRLGKEDWRWLRVEAQLVQYANSNEIKVYLLYRDVDEEKKHQLEEEQLAEEDSLTKVLNRDSFIRRFDWTLERSAKGARSALILIDLDRFKQFSELGGQPAGEALLAELMQGVRSIVRSEDLIGRLGGNEFALCLKDVPYDALVSARARQICDILRRQAGTACVTGSLGIAFSPDDGKNFSELSERADVALSRAKRAEQGGFTFYKPGMTRENQPVSAPALEQGQEGTARESAAAAGKYVLLAGDLGLDQPAFQSLFGASVNLVRAADGTDALRLIKEYGQTLSAILLDVNLRDMGGLDVLKIIEQDTAIFSVPVILFGDGDSEKLRAEAIKLGAEDFLSKPVDVPLMKTRLTSAVIKLENERLRAQNSYLALQNAEEQRYRTVLQSTGTVVFEYDCLSQQCIYDPQANQYLAGQYDNRPLWKILEDDKVALPEDVAKMRELMDSLIKDAALTRQSMNVMLRTAAGGRRRWFRYSLVKMAGGTGAVRCILITLNDVNEEMAANNRLRYLAEYDSLTGLLNRQAFMKRASEMVSVRPGGSYVMSCFDINNFKVVNDRFGHAEGDKLLQHFSTVLQKSVDNYGGICCHITADNFAALLPNVPQILEEMSQVRNQVFARYDLPICITYSVGRYVIDDPSLPVNVMLDRASLAQKSVKGRYGREIYYSDQMREKVLYETRIVNEMERALAQGQFHVYLQPQYDTAKKKIVGAESLVRWIHPELGIIPPGRFVPIFERNGFIEKMDYSMWEQTCQILRKWIDQGRDPIPLSVNISRMEIENMNLREIFMKLMVKYSLSQELLRLEITESAYSENPKQIADVMGELRDFGFTVEMDDFGSGYSSLNVLSSAPVDVLKLDMKFLSMQNEQRGSLILEAVVKMAIDLGLGVIAEGVETVRQADYLSRIGCTVHQGYFYAKPLPVCDFESAYYPEENGRIQ